MAIYSHSNTMRFYCNHGNDEVSNCFSATIACIILQKDWKKPSYAITLVSSSIYTLGYDLWRQTC